MLNEIISSDAKKAVNKTLNSIGVTSNSTKKICLKVFENKKVFLSDLKNNFLDDWSNKQVFKEGLSGGKLVLKLLPEIQVSLEKSLKQMKKKRSKQKKTKSIWKRDLVKF